MNKRQYKKKNNKKIKYHNLSYRNYKKLHRMIHEILIIAKHSRYSFSNTINKK